MRTKSKCENEKYIQNGILENMLYTGKFSKMTKPDMCQQWNVTKWEMNVNKRRQDLKSGLPWSPTEKRKIYVSR